MQKPSIPKGTRDFSPDQLIRRNYIFDIIKSKFKKFGFSPIETPSIENLSTLTGKYGSEGDQLLFKVLLRGEKFKKALKNSNENSTDHDFSLEALRYDLTVPFARYIVQHLNDLTFPFKRYQIQPVWRADRPQKGRYREFYQCDADIVGTNSLICEIELISLITEILNELNLKCEEESITEDFLLSSDELWITNTTKGVVPILKVDGKVLGDGNIGKVYQQVKQEFLKKIEDCKV